MSPRYGLDTLQARTGMVARSPHNLHPLVSTSQRDPPISSAHISLLHVAQSALAPQSSRIAPQAAQARPCTCPHASQAHYRATPRACPHPLNSLVPAVF
ncbi:hypothetical protein MA16_Dca021378 [Dendrobium catenatum]|uniref:Uncharacterized protein n=1 Tax=Dendrobium catenatum TaxID=906689 RepID=A0A2I0WC02_9ASPA|nr:hypothetical protein MA16_Dca021378 [Dendrobium catenatum]